MEKFFLNRFGDIVAESWEWLAFQYKYIKLDEWVIMPNHMHGIIVIKNIMAKQKPLGQLIGAFKTVSTKRINILRVSPGIPVWQRNFYEHIIRNEKELYDIQHYIIENPAKWELDRENPNNW